MIRRARTIERIEIERVPRCCTTGGSPGQLRWKLWSGGRLAYCATGQAVASEITAMINSTSALTHATLGVQPNTEECTCQESR
jgi:hypothetical protein